MPPKVKGSYCKACHFYFRLQQQADGSFYGVCPKCGRKAYWYPDPDEDDKSVFVGTSGRKKREKEIHVWESYAGGRIVGNLKVGTPAKVLATERYNSITWYRITTGTVTGWISGRFIRSLRKLNQ